MKVSIFSRVFSVVWAMSASAAFAGGEGPKAGASWFDEVGLPALLHGGFEPGTSRASDARSFAAVFRQTLATSSVACQISVAEKLGYQVVSGTTGPSQVIKSGACTAVSPARAQEQGTLKITLGDLGDAATALTSAIDSRESACLYQLALEVPAFRAADRLASNGNFTFGIDGDFVNVYGNAEWTRGCFYGSSAYCLDARSSGSRAMDVFTSSSASAECAVGLQVAEYEMQKQAYGATFDQNFAPSEIRVGTWNEVNGSASATWGNVVNVASAYDTNAAQASALGKNAFIGRSGYIGNVYGESYLDSPNDRGENFLTVSVTHAAGEALRAAGGFEHYNQLNQRLFELAQLLSSRDILRYVGTDSDISAYGANAVEMQRILKDPVYRGYITFVHPLGRMTLGQHIVRLLEINPRTPYKFQLYPSLIQSELYYRYAYSLIKECS